MLKTISLQALQFAINQAMGLDPSISEKLLALDQKVIEMVVSPLNVHFYICILKGQFILKSSWHQKPDTIIYSNPMGLIRLSILPSSKMRSLFNDQIRISGDIQLGQQLKQIFDTMHVDWEGHLAFFTGDVVAHHIGKVFRKGRDIGKQYGEGFKKGAQYYLTHEVDMVPSKQDVEQFNHEVDELRLRTERLAAHIQSLSTNDEKF
jgi:ubiquinone biosynthesis protein UbiJ